MTIAKKTLFSLVGLCALLSVGAGAAAATFDNDSKADVAVFRPSAGAWYVRNSSDGSTTAISWGGSGDVVVHGDYDGDGRLDAAIFRPSDGAWYIRNSSDLSMTAISWGGATDNVVPGDYDGDGKTDAAIFRPSDGAWYIRNSSDNSMSAIAWGAATDTPVPGDYDGDGRTDVAVFRPSDGAWYIRNSSNGTMTAIAWGEGTDKVVPGDYDGDGTTDAAIFRPGSGTWYIRNSSDSSMTAITWGESADVLVRPPATAPRRAAAGPFDIRDYFAPQLGDLSIWQDNSLRFVLRTERFADVPCPMYLERSFQSWGYMWEELWYFDASDNALKQYGRYEFSPYDGHGARVLYRYVPPKVVGKTSMKVGDTYSADYTLVNTNTGDNTTAHFGVTIAAAGSVTTPAGTFDNCFRYDGSDEEESFSV
ncbi:MAG TPA: VCBS repeat-containing protein, partial [Candidatus Deferrimicrobiaceae bacterium]